MYYRLMEDYDIPRGVNQDPEIFDELEDMYDVDFGSGQLITNDVIEKLPEPVIFHVDCTPEFPPKHYDGVTIPVMSKELVDLLQQQGVDNLQVFPAILENPETGDTWGDYYAVNIIGLISCADMDASKYSVIGRRPGSDIPLAHFQKLVINEKLTYGHYLFRLAEEPHVILITEFILDALTEHQPSRGQWGIDCIQLETT